MSQQLTFWIAVGQTCAGVGSILAAIALAFAQRRWAREDQRRRVREFCTASARLLEQLHAQSRTTIAILDRSDGRLPGVLTADWFNFAENHRYALRALLASAPSEASVVLPLARAVRHLEMIEEVKHAGLDAAQYRREIEKVDATVSHERTMLQRAAGAFGPEPFWRRLLRGARDQVDSASS